MQLLKSSEYKQKLTILHTLLQNCCDITKTKKRELEELSSPVAAGPDGPDHGTGSGIDSSSILEIGNALLQVGGCSSLPPNTQER